MRDHAAALRAEQRLDDHVAAQDLERLQGRVGVLADDGGRHAQPGGLQQGRGQVLVHADFDGPRRIEDADAGRLEPVQQVHAEDDLLQRTRRHRANQDAVERGKGEPGRVSARRRSAHGRDDAAEIDGGRFMAERGGGTMQVADVPAVAGREQSDAHDGILLNPARPTTLVGAATVRERSAVPTPHPAP